MRVMLLTEVLRRTVEDFADEYVSEEVAEVILTELHSLGYEITPIAGTDEGLKEQP